MGRHAKKVDHGALPDDDDDGRSGWSRRVGKVPLLPTVTGVLTIGAVVSAISTQQISLNFAGGSPSTPRRSPPVTDSVRPEGRPGRHTARDDSSLSAHGGTRAGRGTERSAAAVAFRTTSTWNNGFQGQVRITNLGGHAIDGWTLAFRYPRARILSIWDVRIVRTGTVTVVRNPVQRPSIAPGQTVTVSFTASGSGARPSACVFNGRSCRS